MPAAGKLTSAVTIGHFVGGSFNLLVAVARRSITLEEFNTLALVVESASIAALKCLPAFLNGNENKLYTSVPSAAHMRGCCFRLV